jgi:hypothetical protein
MQLTEVNALRLTLHSEADHFFGCLGRLRFQ